MRRTAGLSPEPAPTAGRGSRNRDAHSKEGRDNQPQVIIVLAVTRDGMPVRSWVLPGDTADVATVARIKDDLSAWRLGRCVFVGDAGMYSAENMAELSRGLGRYFLAVPMCKVKEIELEVLSRPGQPEPQKIPPRVEGARIFPTKGLFGKVSGRNTRQSRTLVPPGPHEGNNCTFEVLTARAGLADPALDAIGEIVHDIDLKDAKFARVRRGARFGDP